MEGTKRNEKKKEVTHSEYSTITPCNRDLNDSYMKLCARLSDEYKNILNCVEGKLHMIVYYKDIQCIIY